MRFSSSKKTHKILIKKIYSDSAENRHGKKKSMLKYILRNWMQKKAHGEGKVVPVLN
jgi:hypothetical protein